MLPSQCNANKTISVLEELFSEHGIPETLRSGNGSKFANHMFAEFAKEWNFDHNTSSPRNPRSNGQAEATVKIVKPKLSTQDKTHTLPSLHLVHPLMPTYNHQLRCSIRETSLQHSHKGSATRTPMLQMTMTDSINVLPIVLSTTTISAEPSPCYMQGKLYLSSTMTRTSGSLLRSFVKLTMAHTVYRL